MSDGTPPRTAERLLESIAADTRLRETVLGDLAEECAARVQSHGITVARRWYRVEALRVAPHLLLDWVRHLGWRGAAQVTNAVLWACLAVGLFEAAGQMTFRGLIVLPAGGITEVPLGAAYMLLWTMLDGAVAGIVAARVGRTAGLHSALVVAALFATLIVAGGHSAMPTWFLALNAVAATTGVLLAAVTTALRTSSRPRGVVPG